jgi:hypothetical protein
MSVALDLCGPRAAAVALLAAVAVLLVAPSVPVADASPVGSCPNEEFRIGPSAPLPDCRAYEMVSPPDKNGGEVDGGVNKGAMTPPEQAAADGEAVTYASSSAFIEAQPASAVVSSQYLSRRTAGGWQTQEVDPKQEVPQGRLELTGEGIPDFSLFQGFNEDLQDGFLLAWSPQPDPAAPERYFNPYLRDDSGEYQLLSDELPPVQSPGQANLEYQGFGALYAGMSADGQHVIFSANDALTPGAIPGQVNLYEWSAGRPLELVSVLPEGAVDTSGGRYTVSGALNENGLVFGSSASAIVNGEGLPGDHVNYSGALSSNGMRAFWSGSGATGEQIYMHEITPAGSRSVHVSASQKSGEPETGATYWTANAEGSLVYFTSGAELTADASTGGGLYQYDVNTGELDDLTVGPNAGEAADVQGVLGAGETEGASYVYFAAGGVLAPGASAGMSNLYLWRSDAGAPTFIATLGKFVGEGTDFAASVTARTSRVSPDGEFLAFQSTRSLTGYDNVPVGGQPCPEGLNVTSVKPYMDPPEGRCMEVFEYDAQAATLVCASCNPSGLPPVADSLVPESQHLLTNIRGWQSPTIQQRYLLDDGRLFFQSEDDLLPEATNDKQNIYEYEPEGVGQCATLGGNCLYLISTGASGGNSYFADASANGRDVFFTTNEQLVPQDGDGVADVYDAREGGGFSSGQLPPCAGEACKPAVTPAPAIYGAPSSATFQGAGDVPMQPAVRTSVKKAARKTQPKKKKKKKKKPRKKTVVKKKTRRGLAGRSARRSDRGRR